LLKNYSVLFLLVMAVTSASWFTGFNLEPADEFDVQDIVIEGLVLLLILTAYIYIFRLKISKLQIGWSIFALGRLIDFFDEFTSEPDFFNTTMEGILVISGLMLTVWGFNEAYLSLRNEIKARKKTEERLLRIQEIQKCVTEVLETIVIEKERDKLFQQTCQILIQARDYKLAWIGLIEDNIKRVMPVASAGYEEGYLNKVTITWDQTETGRGPTGTAIRTKSPAVIKDTGLDPSFEPWCREAQKRDFTSAAAVPLVCGDRIFGALTVYSAYPDAFDSEEVELLQTLARSLAHACYALKMEEKRIELEKKLIRQAREDALTGIYNRYYFNEIIKEEIKRAGRYGYSLTFIMIDIDDFKEINDRFSHLVGDEILKEVGKVLRTSVRESDLAFRYGGDEFLLVLPEANSEGAQKLVERIQKEVKNAQEDSRLKEIKPELSFGITTWRPETRKKWEEVLKESDLKMYSEKRKKKR